MMVPEFPQFYQLELADHDDYKTLVSAYPAISDLAFPTLAIWWVDSKGNLPCISDLHGNLVIDYGNGEDTDITGLTLVGTNQLARSVADLRQYLADHQRKLHLVHVPEFVMQAMAAENLAGLEVMSERDYDEYIISATSMATLEGPEYRRKRTYVKRFLREVGVPVRMERLDLRDQHIGAMLIDAYDDWSNRYGGFNGSVADERAALSRSIGQAGALEMHCLALYAGDELYGYAIFQYAHDGKSIIVNHQRVQYSVHNAFDYLTHQMGVLARSEGVEYLNYEMDLGIEGLRLHKTNMHPVGFFQKYRATLV